MKALRRYFTSSKTHIIEQQREMIEHKNKEIEILEKIKKSQEEYIEQLKSSHDTAQTLIQSLQIADQKKDKLVDLSNDQIDNYEKLVAGLYRQQADMMAYVRTLAGFGGTLDQARELAKKCTEKYSGTLQDA